MVLQFNENGIPCLLSTGMPLIHLFVNSNMHCLLDAEDRNMSVSSGCYNEILHTRHLIKNRNLFFTVLQVEKFKVKVPADSISGEDPAPGS